MAAIREINLNTNNTSPDNPVEEAAIANVKDLFGSDVFNLQEYSVIQSETEELSIHCIASEPNEDNGRVIITTFGAGALDTKGSARIDGSDEVKFRTEFYSVVSSVEEAALVGQTLSKLAFIVQNSQEMFAPGVIVQGLSPEGSNLTHAYFTDGPLGIYQDVKVGPVAGYDFAIFWTHVTLITAEEAALIQEKENGAEHLATFLTNLGREAYSLNRETYSAE